MIPTFNVEKRFEGVQACCGDLERRALSNKVYSFQGDDCNSLNDVVGLGRKYGAATADDWYDPIALFVAVESPV
jgi:hypothetical protein